MFAYTSHTQLHHVIWMNPIIRIYFEALCDLRHENFNTLKIATCYIICRLTLAPHRISSHSCSAVTVHCACMHVCVCVWERFCCPGERKRNNKIKLVIFISREKKMMTEIGHIQIHYPVREASLGCSFHSVSICIHLTIQIHGRTDTHQFEWQIRTAKSKSQSSHRKFISIVSMLRFRGVYVTTLTFVVSLFVQTKIK